jgi:AmmeMemoRadiSam system protein B
VHITRVVLLGPAHRAALAALAVPQASAFITPLGRVSIDQPAVESLAELPQCVRDDAPHEDEHALEVQLPFLQTLLGPFTLVPIVVGDVPAKAVAQALERVWGGDETLVVVSSDLSHYLPYASAQAMDRTTVDRMLALDATLEPENACGARAVNGALLCARKHGLQPRLLGLCNSGDTAGDKRRVVGYASLALEAPR